MTAKSDFYVYLISRPDGTPCYVGKGHGKRWKESAKRSHNRFLQRIHAKYGDLPVSMVHCGLTEADAHALEIETIGLIGRIAHGGPLVNMTDGGEGHRGLAQSPEANEKRRVANLGQKRSPETCARIGDVHRGKVMSPEARAKMSASHTGRKIPAEVRARMSASKIGVKRPREVVERIRAAQTGAKRSAETRAKMSESAKRRHARTRELRGATP